MIFEDREDIALFCVLTFPFLPNWTAIHVNILGPPGAKCDCIALHPGYKTIDQRLSGGVLLVDRKAQAVRRNHFLQSKALPLRWVF